LAFIIRILTGNFLLLLLHLGYTTKQKNIPCKYLLQLLVHGQQGPLYVFWVSSVCNRDVEGSGDYEL